jgi:hypothetical protein
VRFKLGGRRYDREDGWVYDGTDYWLTDDEMLRFRMRSKASSKILRFFALPIFLVFAGSLLLAYGVGWSFLLVTVPVLFVGLLLIIPAMIVVDVLSTRARRRNLNHLPQEELFAEAARATWSSVQSASLAKPPVRFGEWGLVCLLTLYSKEGRTVRMGVSAKDFGPVSSFIHSRIGERLAATVSEADMDSGVRGIKWEAAS